MFAFQKHGGGYFWTCFLQNRRKSISQSVRRAFYLPCVPRGTFRDIEIHERLLLHRRPPAIPSSPPSDSPFVFGQWHQLHRVRQRTARGNGDMEFVRETRVEADRHTVDIQPACCTTSRWSVGALGSICKETFGVRVEPGQSPHRDFCNSIGSDRAGHEFAADYLRG